MAEIGIGVKIKSIHSPRNFFERRVKEKDRIYIEQRETGTVRLSNAIACRKSRGKVCCELTGPLLPDAIDQCPLTCHATVYDVMITSKRNHCHIFSLVILFPNFYRKIIKLLLNCIEGCFLNNK